MIKHYFIKFSLGLFFLCVVILVCRTILQLSHTLTPDFSVYYQAAKNLLTSQSVYVGHTNFTLFAYPLISTLFFIPFTLFPYQFSQTLFLFINIFALLFISFIIPLIIYHKRNILFSAIIFSFAYLSFPTKFTLGMGQVNLIAYAFLLTSFFTFQKKKIILTALLFTIACICKPILGFVLLFFIFEKQWKIIFYVLAFLLISFMLTFLFDNHALQDYIYYIQHIIPEVSKSGDGREIYYNQGLLASVYRIITNQLWRNIVSFLGMFLIFIIGCVTVLKQKNPLFQLSVILTLLPLLDTMSWQHHFIFLIFPFTYVTLLFWQQKKYIMLFAIGIAYIFVSWNFKYPTSLNIFPYNLLFSNTFFGGFLLFIILLFIPRVCQSLEIKKKA